MKAKRIMGLGFLVVGVGFLIGISGCVREASPTTVAPTMTTATPSPVVGMKIGERFHEIHGNKLALQCTYCHATEPATFDDPLAQVSSQVDKRACLSCHKEGGVQPFYGENWTKASVER